MTRRRTFILICTCLLVSPFLASTASARGSSRGGRTRIIDDDDNKSQKKREEARKKKEEARKRAEARKKEKEAKKEAKKKALAEKREAARKKTAQAPKPARKPKKAEAPKKQAKAKDTGADAAKLYEQAEAAFEKGELLPGVALLRQVLAEHEGSDAARLAEDRLDQLLGDERFGPMIVHGEAEELFAVQRYRQALHRYNKLIATYPDSEQAPEAQKRIAEIRDGDLLSKTVYSDEELADARFWLLVGNIHLENQRHADAAAAYRKVVENYPGCPYATQAEQKLAATSGS